MNEVAIYLFPVALLAGILVAAATGYYAGLKRGYDEGYRDGRR